MLLHRSIQLSESDHAHLAPVLHTTSLTYLHDDGPRAHKHCPDDEEQLLRDALLAIQ